MNIVLFESTATEFDTQGQGVLTDAIKCTVTEELNGQYVLELEYPSNGIHASEIELRSIITCAPTPANSRQAFRVYQIKSNISGKLTIYAEHISYDLSGYIVAPFTATSLSNACTGLVNNAKKKPAFTINTNMSSNASFKVTEPSSLRSWFVGREGSMVDVYGGEWRFNNFTCTLMQSRGKDRGVTVRYGKNLLKYDRQDDDSSQYTQVMGYYKYTDDNNQEKIVQGSLIATGITGYDKMLALDVSEQFDTTPTATQINNYVRQYISRNNVAGTKVSLDFDFVQLNDTIDLVELGDIVHVIYKGDVITAQCYKTVWDALRERYTSVMIGARKGTLTTTIKQIVGGASGNVTYVGGGGGTSDYNALVNKPRINNITLAGNKTGADLGLVSEADLSDALTSRGIYPSHILFDTTANWSAQTTLKSEKNAVYVYTDYQSSDGQNLAGIKVGDGLAYVVDLPFIDKIYANHVEDSTIHITPAEREFWNNKNRAYISLSDAENMILTVN